MFSFLLEIVIEVFDFFSSLYYLDWQSFDALMLLLDLFGCLEDILVFILSFVSI